MYDITVRESRKKITHTKYGRQDILKTDVTAELFYFGIQLHSLDGHKVQKYNSETSNAADKSIVNN
jgi:hypothetical protein